MRITFILILGLVSTSLTSKNNIEDEILKVLQHNLRNSINRHLTDFQERMSHLLVKPLSFESTAFQDRMSALLAKPSSFESKSRELTPAVIEKALYHVKDILPEVIPIIPFAVTEPTSSNILIYFSNRYSYFRNITDFTCNSSVNNAASSSSTNLDMHVESSSLKGHYELDVSSYDMHLYGNGDYSLDSNGTDVSIFTNVEISADNSFKMTDFLVTISISSAKLTMNNLLDGDPSGQELTEIMSEKIPAEVATLNEMIQQSINSSVVDIVNSYVAALMSWRDVVDLVYILADI